MSLTAGQNARLSATPKDEGGNALSRSIIWTSSNPLVATVDSSGKVTAIAPGSATMTASSDGVSAAAFVAVYAGSEFPPSDGPIVFSDDFETGNHHTWKNPDPGGPLNEILALDFTSNERARSGRYSYKFYGISLENPLVPEFNLNDLDRISIKLLHWGPWADGDAYLYSAWYYWPSDYHVYESALNKYTNIMQWKGRGKPDWDPTWVVAVQAVPGADADEIVLHDWHGRMTGQDIHKPATSVTPPKDRWFNVTALYIPDKVNGTIKVWVDFKLLLALEGVPTLTSDYQDRDLMWGVGNYGGSALGPDGDTPRGFFVDDVVVRRVLSGN